MHLIETMSVMILFSITLDTTWFSEPTVFGHRSAINSAFSLDHLLLQEGHKLCREFPTECLICIKGSHKDV